jgi:hypothetical protein
VARRKKRRLLRYLAWTGGIAATVLGSLIVYQLTNPEIIHPRTARQFLQQYYKEAVKQGRRDQAWGKLTPGFQNSETVKNRREYDKFWSKIKEVRVGSVDNVIGERNRFLTKLTYVSRKDKEWGPRKTTFNLVCSTWASIDPLNNCDPDEIKIDYTTEPARFAELV